MIYADFTYYQNTYGGRKIAEADSMRLLRRASVYLDMLTLNKITDSWAEDERVKCACCAAAEVYAQQEQGGEVASETNHNVSKTYAVSGKSVDRQLYDVAAMYLVNTGLLCRRVKSDWL